jgi:hypothetical protein
LQKTLNAQLDKGVTASLTLTNVTGIQNKPGVVVINRIDSNSAELAASLREYVSYTAVSGSTLTGLARHLGGTADQDHAVGSVVEFILDITWGQAMIDAFLVEHKEADATHGAVTATSINLGSTIAVTGTLDEDNMASNSAVKVATQQSIKAYVDSGTVTLTNKRITPRVVTATDDATAVIDVDVTDQYQLTAVANATTISTTGTPVAGQKLIIRLKDAGVAKGLTWDGVFRAVGVTLPTTTVVSKTHYIGCLYNLTDTKWDVVAVLVEA